MGDISLAVGPQSWSCKEIVKTLQRHSKLLPCSLISVLSESETHQNLSLSKPLALKVEDKISQLFVMLIRGQGKRNMYLL